MKKNPESIVDTILSENSSVERVRAAFQNFGEAIIRSQQSLDKTREKIEKDMRDGARSTKHRFHI